MTRMTRTNTKAERRELRRFALVAPKERRLVLHKLELQSHAAVGAVIKGAELLRIQVVLHVARVPVICDVEDRQPRPSFVFLAAKRNRNTFRHQQVERHQLRKAAALVTRTNEVLLLVHE